MDALYRSDTTYFARTNHRNQDRLFGIKHADRLLHTYIIGRTGTGKSTLLETLITQDIHKGNGVALLDPHGDLVERLAARVPEHRRRDLVYLNVPDLSQPYGYNPLKRVRPEQRSLAASGIMEVLRSRWDGRSWGVRMEHILRNTLLALLDQPEAKLPDILRMLLDKRFRADAIRHIQNPTVRGFWEQEFKHYSFATRADGIAPIQNKIGAFLADPLLLRILTKPTHRISLRQIMDQGKILLVNLSKGKLGDDTASLLGGLLVSTIGLAAFSRADIREGDRRDFFLYADEFQNFTTSSFVGMASELRKFHVGMICANQYMHQLDPDIRHAILGNAGTLISFRLGAEDATFLQKEFQPKFDAVDLLNLPNHCIYLKLLIDGAPSLPFSAATIQPEEVAAA